jgi:hypothetical protein
MSKKVKNPKDLPPIKENTSDPLSKAVGIWKDRWPKEVNLVEIVRRVRNSELNSDRSK